MWTAFKLLVASTVCLCAVGCASALAGRWTAAIDPPKNPKFFVKQIDFQKDGTYSASVRRGQEDVPIHGKYDYDGFTLTLKPGTRPERRYRAMVIWGRELQVTADGEKQTLMKK